MTTQEDPEMDAAATGTRLEAALKKVASELSDATAALRERVDQLRDATTAVSPPQED
jgi:hypothetical protein